LVAFFFAGFEAVGVEETGRGAGGGDGAGGGGGLAGGEGCHDGGDGGAGGGLGGGVGPPPSGGLGGQVDDMELLPSTSAARCHVDVGGLSCPARTCQP
jgi:hypothetical protein